MAIVKLRKEHSPAPPHKPNVSDLVVVAWDVPDDSTRTLLKVGSVVKIESVVTDDSEFGESYTVVDLSGKRFTKQLSFNELNIIKEWFSAAVSLFVQICFYAALYSAFIYGLVSYPVVPPFLGIIFMIPVAFLGIGVCILYIPFLRSCKEYYLFRKKVNRYGE